MAQRQIRTRWLVEIDFIDDDRYHYGPYTEAEAIKVESRVRRRLESKYGSKYGIEGGDWLVSSFPISRFRLSDLP